jgi:hypothetical protein
MNTFKGNRDITFRRHVVDVGENAVSVKYGRSSSMINRADVVAVEVQGGRTVIRTRKRSYRMAMPRRVGKALQQALI